MNEGTSLTGSLSDFVRWAFGAPRTIPAPGADEGAHHSGTVRSQITPASHPSGQWRRFPRDAAVCTQGWARWFDHFYDRYRLYVARREDQVLATASAFQRQELDSGEIEWEEQYRDEEPTRERVE